METIVFGGGCFWCTEAVFLQLRGVVTVVSGYAGGTVPNPTYEAVCTGQTGHAEVIKITFDPKIIQLETLLEVFWAVHDPTTLNRQGADEGTQYRSIVLYTPEQHATVKHAYQNAQSHWNNQLTTVLAELKTFYPAEEYHQNYFAKHPEKAYCQIVINPKLGAFRQKFASLLC